MKEDDARLKTDCFGYLLEFLNWLDAERIDYAIRHTTLESVMVNIGLPGWCGEVEFMADGAIEIERYKSFAGIEDDAVLLEDIFTEVDLS